MFCPKCGKQIMDESRYCGFCGVPIVPINQDINSPNKMSFSETATSNGTVPNSIHEASDIHENEDSWALSRIAGIIGTVLSAIGTGLPLLTVSVMGFSDSRNMYEVYGEAGADCVVFILGMLITFFGFAYLNRAAAIAGSVLTLYVSIRIFMDFNELGTLEKSLASLEPGFFLYTFGGVVSIISSFFVKPLDKGTATKKEIISMSENPQNDDRPIGYWVNSGTITCVEGEYAQAVFPLENNETILIGRTADVCQIVLSDPAVARRHCAITYKPDNTGFQVTFYAVCVIWTLTGHYTVHNQVIMMNPGDIIYIGRKNVFRLDLKPKVRI